MDLLIASVKFEENKAFNDAVLRIALSFIPARDYLVLA